jgi:hypothetical protein
MTNATYTDYPFTSHGVNFISRVYSHSDLFDTIARLPMGVFEDLNRKAVEELIGDPSELSTPELLNQLTHLNNGGSHAFIMLGDN